MQRKNLLINCILTLIPFIVGWFFNVAPVTKAFYYDYRMAIDLVMVFAWIFIGWKFAMDFKDTSLGIIIGNFVWGLSLLVFLSIYLYGFTFLSFFDSLATNFVFNYVGIGASILQLFNNQSIEYAHVAAYFFMFVLFILGFSLQRILLKKLRTQKK